MIGSGKISHLSKPTVPHLFYQCRFCILPSLHNYLSLSEFFIVFHNPAFSPTIPSPSHNVLLSTIPGLFYNSPYFSRFPLRFSVPHTILRFHFLSQFNICQGFLFSLQFPFFPTIPVIFTIFSPTVYCFSHNSLCIP